MSGSEQLHPNAHAQRALCLERSGLNASIQIYKDLIKGRFGAQNRILLQAQSTIPHNRTDVGKTIRIPVKKLFLLS